MPTRLAVRDISLFERPVPFAKPFRFGAVVINASVQAFVRVEIEVEGKAGATGASAELMASKWFDKRPELSPQQTVDELRRSLSIARELYLSGNGFETAFGLHASRIAAQIEACAREDIPPLAAGFGPAEIDKAILDALLRFADLGFFDGMNRNIAGIDARLSPDVENEDIAQFLSRRRRLERVAIRHTVGLDDQVEGKGGVADVEENAGARYFKLKLNGDPEHDAARLIRIGKELATLPEDYAVTLDANEQYADLTALGALVDWLDRDGALAPIATKLLYIEQPMPRDITRESPLGALGARDFIIDEADEFLRCVSGCACAWLSRHLVEILQGHLQVHRQRHPRRQVERRRREILHRGGGPHLPGRTWRAAGPRARRPDRDHPCRTQRPSLCRRFRGYAGLRGGGVSRGASRSLCARRRQGPAVDPWRRSPDGVADHAGICRRRASAMDGDVAAPATNGKNAAGAENMTTQRLGVIMNGVTGRMGLNQHLIRSIVAIRDQGGVRLANGDRVMPDPILVGRDAAKVEQLAKRFDIARWTADLDGALREKSDTIFFDAATTQARPSLLTKAINAGKHVYCEKPIATNLEEAVAVLKLAAAKGIKHGTVQDKLFLPGLKKLAFLRDSGFFGRITAVRGEFGYWVFEGDWQEAQRPSWNYRSEDGGGIILDMVCHWRYVLDNLFGDVESVSCLGSTDIPERWDERGEKYKATADDSAYATFRLKGGVIAHINMSWATRVYRDDLVTFQVDGTLGSAVAGLSECMIQARQATPRPVWNPDEKRTHDFYADWQKLPENTTYDNGFKEQWEIFIRHVCEDAPYKFTLLEGAKGVQLAECALQSWRERRWIDVAPIKV